MVTGRRSASRCHGNGPGLPAAAGSGAARGSMAAGSGWPSVAVAITLLLSLGASTPGLLPGASAAASLRPAALRAGEGSFEKNVGTVKHCFLTIAFAILSALLYLLLETVVLRVSEVEDAKGFMPVAFAMLGVSTTRSRMKRTLFFGVRVPVVLMPWFMLCVAWFIPSSSLLSNLCGLLVGEAYGLGYCFCLDFPEPVGSKLDRMFPFNLLKRIPGLKYIPGSLAERRAFESSKINPAPGTYPTQSYYCSSPPDLPAFQMQHPNTLSQGFQQSCAPGYGHALGHEGSQHGHAAGHGLTSSPYQVRGASGECYVQAHAGALPGQCCQLGKFSPCQHMCPTDGQTPAGMAPLAGVQQASGYPAATVAPVLAEFSRVQVY